MILPKCNPPAKYLVLFNYNISLPSASHLCCSDSTTNQFAVQEKILPVGQVIQYENNIYHSNRLLKKECKYSNSANVTLTDSE